MAKLLSLTVTASHRPVDWRWQRAQALRRYPAWGRSAPADNYVRILVNFQHDLEACGGDECAEADLAAEYPDLAAAWSWRFDGDEAAGLRAELEARLLARDTFEHIAQRLSATPGALRWYEAAFYHVTDRLHNRGYLLHHAVGTSIHSGIAPHEFDLYWKVIGLVCGPLMLDDVIGFCKEVLVTSSAQVEPAYAEQQRSLMRRQALRAAAGLRLRDPFAALQLTDIEVRQQESERQAGVSTARDLLVQGVQALFGTLEKVWRAPGEKPLGVLAELQNLPVVPRSQELLEAARSGKTEELKQRLLSKKFPPPPQPELLQGAPTAPGKGSHDN